MKYRLYTISTKKGSNSIAIPEDRVENFDLFLESLPEGEEIEEILNRFDAVLVG